MLKRTHFAAAAVVLLATAVPLKGTAAVGEKTLSLQDCILSALENNLRLAAERVTPEIADLSVSRASEKFMPVLGLSYDTRDTNTASYSFIDAAVQVSSTIQNYGVVLNQTIPTGGTLSASLSSYRNETNRRFQTINPRYGSTLSFSFVQPLLKNFGWKISRREIIIARNNRDMTEAEFRTTLSNVIFGVEEAYWGLVYSKEYLEVREQSLQLARDLLEESRRKVEVGTLAPIELFTAEAEVATREADILQARAMVDNSRDRLRSIINMPELLENKDLKIVPTDDPHYEEQAFDYDTALAVAMEKRPELEALRANLKTRRLNVKYAGNQLLPELNLTASYWSPGISGDRILYQDNNALTGIIIGTVPGPASDALKDAFGFKYNNWNIGLTLDIPLSTALSRADFVIARANLRQALLRMEDMERELGLELQTALREVETGYKRILAYASALELARKKLEAETEKLSVGKSTNYLLLQFQRDLADARTTELKAKIDYTLALADLDRVMGTTFEAKNIVFSPSPADTDPAFSARRPQTR